MRRREFYSSLFHKGSPILGEPLVLTLISGFWATQTSFQEKDRHFFKVPVLRNIELTYPYFHDGSVDNLAEAVRIMGKVQRGKDFTSQEIAKVVVFLKTLTGEYKGKSLTKLTAEDIK